jgi:hypothetical protein
MNDKIFKNPSLFVDDMKSKITNKLNIFQKDKVELELDDVIIEEIQELEEPNEDVSEMEEVGILTF